MSIRTSIALPVASIVSRAVLPYRIILVFSLLISLVLPGYSNPTRGERGAPAKASPTYNPFQSISFRATSRGGNAPEFPFQLGVARFFKNEVKFYEEEGGGGGGRGFNVAAINMANGELIQFPSHFDTWADRTTGGEHNNLISFLNGLSNGTLIMIAVADEAGLNQFDSCSFLPFTWTESLIQTLESLGSRQIRNYCYRGSFAMITVKGEGQARDEQVANGSEASAQTTINVTTPCPVVSGISPLSATIGSLVSITGTNFSGVNSVRFSGNVAANFSVIGDTQINVTVPAGAVTGPITLRKNDCDDVKTETFVVITPCPFAGSITPSAATAGSAVAIAGTNLSGVSSVKFFNNVAANFSVISDTQINATVPAGAATGPVTLSRPGCNDTQTNTFTLLPVPPPGPGPSEVFVRGRQLIVRKRNQDGTLGPAAPYVMTGVNWSPASRETNTTPFDPNNANVRRPEFGIWAATDIPLMKRMNVNTVRLYIDPGFDNVGRATLDQLYSNGIMVILTVDDAINDQTRAQQVVNFYKDHPAILMWMLGSEWNINHYFGVAPSVQDAAQRTQTAAVLVKSLDANHPVATSYGEIDINADGLRLADTTNYVRNICPGVDVWSLNIYRGNTFGNLFSQWESISTKPMFIGEFGTDAFRSATTTNPPQGAVDEAMQSEWDVSLWNHIAMNLSSKDDSKAALGGLKFEFNDEWWKVSPPGSQQSNGFFLFGGHPDNFANEEYFGAVTIDRVPRQVYNALATAFEQARKTEPEITSASFNGKKKLTIRGNRFGSNPRVIINGTDRTNFSASASETTILLKAKQKKLGLVTGDNTVQIVNANGASNLFILKL